MTDGTLERIEDYMERGNALLVRIDEHLEPESQTHLQSTSRVARSLKRGSRRT